MLRVLREERSGDTKHNESDQKTALYRMRNFSNADNLWRLFTRFVGLSSAHSHGKFSPFYDCRSQREPLRFLFDDLVGRVQAGCLLDHRAHGAIFLF